MRLALKAAGMVIATGAAVMVAASPASATPTGCSFYTNGPDTAGFVICNSGTGTYYGHITCTDELRGSNSYVNGPRVNIGTGSGAVCPKQGGVQFLATAGAVGL